MFRLMNQETGFIEVFTLDELLEMINRDRSHEWSEYTEKSTLREVIEIIDDMCSPYSTFIKKG